MAVIATSLLVSAATFAHAQDVRDVAAPGATVPRSIAGIVFDSIAHRPLSGAHVHLADLGRDAVADSLGAFRFDSVGAGAHSVWADHPALDALGLYSIGAGVDATPQAVTRVTLAIPSFATLAGAVRDSAGQPVHDARVTVSGVAGEWRANVNGGFVVRGIPSGTRVITIRALGLAPERRLVDFASRDSAYLDLSMTRLITTLATVTIREREHLNALKSELDQRRRAGFGYRADSSDFAKLMSVGQALNFPGVHVSTIGARWVVYMTGVYSMTSKGGTGIARSCTPTVWIDGMKSDWAMVNELKKEEIALIEIYNSAARAPLQFTGTGTLCGVVLVWRKRYIDP